MYYNINDILKNGSIEEYNVVPNDKFTNFYNTKQGKGYNSPAYFKADPGNLFNSIRGGPCHYLAYKLHKATIDKISKENTLEDEQPFKANSFAIRYGHHALFYDFAIDPNQPEESKNTAFAFAKTLFKNGITGIDLFEDGGHYYVQIRPQQLSRYIVEFLGFSYLENTSKFSGSKGDLGRTATLMYNRNVIMAQSNVTGGNMDRAIDSFAEFRFPAFNAADKMNTIRLSRQGRNDKLKQNATSAYLSLAAEQKADGYSCPGRGSLLVFNNMHILGAPVLDWKELSETSHSLNQIIQRTIETLNFNEAAYQLVSSYQGKLHDIIEKEWGIFEGGKNTAATRIIDFTYKPLLQPFSNVQANMLSQRMIQEIIAKEVYVDEETQTYSTSRLLALAREMRSESSIMQHGFDVDLDDDNLENPLRSRAFTVGNTLKKLLTRNHNSKENIKEEYVVRDDNKISKLNIKSELFESLHDFLTDEYKKHSHNLPQCLENTNKRLGAHIHQLLAMKMGEITQFKLSEERYPNFAEWSCFRSEISGYLDLVPQSLDTYNRYIHATIILSCKQNVENLKGLKKQVDHKDKDRKELLRTYNEQIENEKTLLKRHREARNGKDVSLDTKSLDSLAGTLDSAFAEGQRMANYIIKNIPGKDNTSEINRFIKLQIDAYPYIGQHGKHREWINTLNENQRAFLRGTIYAALQLGGKLPALYRGLEGNFTERSGEVNAALRTINAEEGEKGFTRAKFALSLLSSEGTLSSWSEVSPNAQKCGVAYKEWNKLNENAFSVNNPALTPNLNLLFEEGRSFAKTYLQWNNSASPEAISEFIAVHLEQYVSIHPLAASRIFLRGAIAEGLKLGGYLPAEYAGLESYFNSNYTGFNDIAVKQPEVKDLIGLVSQSMLGDRIQGSFHNEPRKEIPQLVTIMAMPVKALSGMILIEDEYKKNIKNNAQLFAKYFGIEAQIGQDQTWNTDCVGKPVFNSIRGSDEVACLDPQFQPLADFITKLIRFSPISSSLHSYNSVGESSLRTLSRTIYGIKSAHPSYPSRCAYVCAYKEALTEVLLEAMSERSNALKDTQANITADDYFNDPKIMTIIVAGEKYLSDKFAADINDFFPSESKREMQQNHQTCFEPALKVTLTLDKHLIDSTNARLESAAQTKLAEFRQQVFVKKECDITQPSNIAVIEEVKHEPEPIATWASGARGKRDLGKFQMGSSGKNMNL
ncbi:MAG: hypothetical protein IPP74_01115 [Alphaproteobacteria bacterium]|nr:hypothetical protein [Alphaproteobacteria bacterium]